MLLRTRPAWMRTFRCQSSQPDATSVVAFARPRQRGGHGRIGVGNITYPRRTGAHGRIVVGNVRNALPRFPAISRMLPVVASKTVTEAGWFVVRPLADTWGLPAA